jgi:hypothetical protein
MRVAPREAVESFSSWVTDQIATKSKTRADLETLEENLLVALQGRDIPGALLHACAIVYLDPGHQAALRIKKRCMEEMRRGPARPKEVPFMRFRWSELRDRPLSSDAVCLLSCIDGESKIEDVIKTSGIPAAVAHEVFGELLREGLVGMRSPKYER